MGDEALQPIQYHEIDWGAVDAWSLSCTSPYPPGFLTKWGQYIQLLIGRLIWSGTETSDIGAGAMDGAVRAGHRSALQALGRSTVLQSNRPLARVEA
ncbi:FAD-dependent oxidoreductase [Sphingobium sp.]|uniref:FAD-dependent oxidoreductase n=1 Tax=Sphingobium sp. TaxID=1912891 RepID=UPI00391AF358